MDNKFRDTAYQLLGIDDNWTVADIREHLEWLIDNPDDIVDGYDKSVFETKNVEYIMNWVIGIKTG